MGNVKSIDWQRTLVETRNRMDFKGIEFRANFGDYPPYCVITNKGSKRVPSGIFPESVRVFGSVANLTVTFVEAKPENDGVWSAKLPNGSLTGMLAEIIDHSVDASVAGFIVTFERAKVTQYSTLTDQATSSLIIQRPNENAASTNYHTLEFTPNVWIGLLVTYVFLWIFMAMLTFGFGASKKSGSSFLSALIQSISICLRAYISKV